MNTDLRETSRTFAKLYDLHGWIGHLVPCSWEGYRAEMVETYDMEGKVLDSMRRLGHFFVTPNSVSFRARR